MDNRTTGKQLKKWRERHNWGREVVAVLAGCHIGTIDRNEQQGDGFISGTLQSALARVEEHLGGVIKVPVEVRFPLNREEVTDGSVVSRRGRRIGSA